MTALFRAAFREVFGTDSTPQPWDEAVAQQEAPHPGEPDVPTAERRYEKWLDRAGVA